MRKLILILITLVVLVAGAMVYVWYDNKTATVAQSTSEFIGISPDSDYKLRLSISVDTSNLPAPKESKRVDIELYKNGNLIDRSSDFYNPTTQTPAEMVFFGVPSGDLTVKAMVNPLITEEMDEPLMVKEEALNIDSELEEITLNLSPSE